MSVPSCLQWSYSGDPGASDLDHVRFLVGDTVSEEPLLDDREVLHAISDKVNLHMAASMLADHLAARYSRKANFTVGPVSKSMGDLADKFRQLAKDLKKEAASGGAAPSFPATKVAEKETLQQDDTLTKPQFEIGMFDNYRAVQPNDSVDYDPLTDS